MLSQKAAGTLSQILVIRCWKVVQKAVLCDVEGYETMGPLYYRKIPSFYIEIMYNQVFDSRLISMIWLIT